MVCACKIDRAWLAYLKSNELSQRYVLERWIWWRMGMVVGGTCGEWKYFLVCKWGDIACGHDDKPDKELSSPEHIVIDTESAVIKGTDMPPSDEVIQALHTKFETEILPRLRDWAEKYGVRLIA